MIEAPDFLPLGSVVSLKGNSKKLTVVGRGIVIPLPEGREYYDYALVPYPQGFIGTAAIYTHADQIESIYSRGYSDEEDEAWVGKILEAMSQTSVKRATLSPVGLEW